ncbi:hypothetical protein [uncultured Parasutterella sp.]|jgi:hypothetical protein|uniref:hypothetical protein n=1 Tax=uncultured Parasutterella sp. TaxID=1263098 RepID=UPI0025D2099D|nr:hypothetical protein [uncultured Parasutterella sp.]
MNDKLKQIADHYGLEVQVAKLAEECAEFSASNHKVLYYHCLLDDPNPTRVSKAIVREQFETAREQNAEELADALLVAKQVEYLIEGYPELKEKIDKLMEAKIERQLKRMEEEKAK